MAKFLKVSAFVLAVLAMSVSVMAYGVSPGVDGVANSFVVVEA